MHLTTMRIANSVIGVSLLALLAAALVAGQSRARYHNVAMADASPVTGVHSTLILTRESLTKFESLPQVVDTMLSLPLTLEIGVDGVTVLPESVSLPGHRVK